MISRWFPNQNPARVRRRSRLLRKRNAPACCHGGAVSRPHHSLPVYAVIPACGMPGYAGVPACYYEYSPCAQPSPPTIKELRLHAAPQKVRRNTLKKMGTDNQWVTKKMQKIFQEIWSCREKAVILHPLSRKNEAIGLWKIVNTRCSTRTGNDILYIL